MSRDELEQYLSRLGLSTAEAAQLLSINPRTIRRWLDGEEIPGPAEQAIRAWIRLHDRHLPWRPDSASIRADDQDQIARQRTHAIDLDEALSRVEARGGARLPWVVDWDRGRATLGTMEVTFYKLANGGFSLATYRRGDSDPDVGRDREIIEDAAYCIAAALKKRDLDFGPVTLFSHDGPAKGRGSRQRAEPFPTLKTAILSACERLGAAEFHDPFITKASSTELLWEPQELLRECERRSAAPPALHAIAAYTRNNSSFFIRTGPQMLTPAATAQRQQRIEALADELDALADRAREGLVRYPDFDSVLGALHATGFFPEGRLVSDVARALVRG